MAPFISTTTVLQLDHRASTRDTARRLRQHRPAHAVRLATLVADINALRSRRRVRASPVIGFRITSSSGVLAAEGDADSVLRTSAVTAFSAPRRVLPTADHDSAGQHVGDVQDRAAPRPLRRFTSNRSGVGSARRLRRHRIARAVRLAALVVGAAAPRSASPGAGSPVTGFRTTPCTCVSATAIPSVSVLDTTAFTTSRTLATQSPWRLPAAGFSGVRSPSRVPRVSSFLTACAGSGSHTPRSGLRVCASRTFDRRLSAQPPPSAARLLLDRAYVAPIHDVLLAPDHAGLRLSCTDTRAIHACRYRKHGPIHDRHAHMMAASAARTPRIEGAFAEIATPPPIW